MENEVNTSGLRLLIITGEGPANDDIRRLEGAARQRGHLPSVVPWNELSVALDDRGPRLCAGGVPLEVDGIIHQMSTDALDGLVILGAVEEDVPHLNSVDAVLRSADKFATHVRLVAHGVPTPPTAFCPNDDELRLFARDYGYPVVLKQPDGARGRRSPSRARRANCSPRRPRSGDGDAAAGAAVRRRGGRDQPPGDRRRREVRRGGRADGRPPGDFRSNGPGDVCRPVTLTEEEIEIVERTARAAELDLMSADLLRSEDGPVILETNSFPAFGGFDHVDLCAHVLDVIERKVREHVPLVLPQSPSSEELLVAEVEEELAIQSGKGSLAASAVRDASASGGKGPCRPRPEPAGAVRADRADRVARLTLRPLRPRPSHASGLIPIR
nr:hypothetical protein GCM10020093_013130 [Planobispora longispora]